MYSETEDVAPARIACVDPSGHCTGLFGSRFQALALYGALSSLWLPIPLCRLSSDPPSRDVFSPPRRSPIPLSLPFSRQLCPPSRLFVRVSRRYVAIFYRFYFGEHLVAGMRTKETCSLRKSQEAKGVARSRG